MTIIEKVMALDQPNCYQSLFPLNFSQCLSTIGLSCPSLCVLEFMKWHTDFYLKGLANQATWSGTTFAPCRPSTAVPQSAVLGPLLLVRSYSHLGFPTIAILMTLFFFFPPSYRAQHIWQTSHCVKQLISSNLILAKLVLYVP